MMITDHAVQQAAFRVFEYRGKSENYIRANLLKKLTNSNQLQYHNRPGHAVELICEGIAFVMRYSKNEQEWIVVTCLGDKRYRGWLREEKKKLRKTVTR